MMSAVKKIICFVLLITVVLFLTGGTPGQKEDESASLLRLHVRANSDSAADQALKYQVRDTILHSLDLRLATVQSNAEAEQEIIQALPELLALAETTVREAGYNYGVSAQLGEAEFPTRLYGEQVYRAGRYRALQIYLGEGRGENWWCVLFPPLCFIEVSRDTAVSVSGESESIRPRSRLLEWWQRRFGRQS
ncbi:MAG: stage II sporulation protein R [Clostridiales bacterium]|nr:stage II sporulation protein R [Clostridiales bacterium]